MEMGLREERRRASSKEDEPENPAEERATGK
jgi:hypothetical protein